MVRLSSAFERGPIAAIALTTDSSLLTACANDYGFEHVFERQVEALAKADIGYRIITGGCITRHDVMKYYDYECLDDLPNANAAHDRGFFVGNHPFDLSPQIERLRDVLDNAAR